MAIIPQILSTAGAGQTQMVYMPDQQVQQRLGGRPDPTTSRLVAQYRPEQEVLVAIERQDAGISTYRLAGHLTPPAAYQQRK